MNKVMFSCLVCGVSTVVAASVSAAEEGGFFSNLAKQIRAEREAITESAKKEKTAAKEAIQSCDVDLDAFKCPSREAVDAAGASMETPKSICGFKFGESIDGMFNVEDVEHGARGCSYGLEKPFREFQNGTAYVTWKTKRGIRLELTTMSHAAALSNMVEEYEAVRNILVKHYKAKYCESHSISESPKSFGSEPPKKAKRRSPFDNAPNYMKGPLRDLGQREAYFRIGDLTIVLSLMGADSQLKMRVENIKLTAEAKAELMAEKSSAPSGEDAL